MCLGADIASKIVNIYLFILYQNFPIHRQLSPTWDEIAHLTSGNTLVVGKFNCESPRNNAGNLKC